MKLISKVIAIFFWLYGIYDIVSDALWLVEDAFGKYLAQDPHSTGAQTLCYTGLALVIINTIRFFLQLYGKYKLQDMDESYKNERALVYASRQYLLEDLGGIIMVTVVSKKLGEFSTFAELSLVGNVGAIVMSIAYAAYM